MNELHNLPNIGSYIEEKLYEAGIYEEAVLRELGAKAAFLKIREIDDTVCIRVLYALEGALQGMKDSQLSASDKADLKAFFKSL